MSALRGRLGRYAWWQLRDYAMGPGIGTLAIVGLVSVAPIVAMIRAVNGDTASMPIDELVTQAFAGMVQLVALLGPILAVGGIVSSDRQPGLGRFLFSKPIDVSRYYLQLWCVRGIGLVAVTAILALALQWFAAPVPWRAGLQAVALAWLLLGGVGFLLSVLVAREVGYVILISLVTTLLEQMTKITPQWRWVDLVLSVLPPFHKLAPLRTAMLAGTPMDGGDLALVTLWGLASIVVAVLMVRRLPLVR